MNPINGITPFATPIDNVSSSLAAFFQSADTSIFLAPGTGSLFGNPSPISPVRVTISLSSALSIYGSVINRLGLTVYLVTGRNGDQLTGVTYESGLQQDFPVGSPVFVLKNASADGDQNFAINTLEATVIANASSVTSSLAAMSAALASKAPLISPGLTGVPTINGQAVATQQWVIGQGYSTGGGGGGGSSPAFGVLTFYVDDHLFGAVADGVTDNSAAFQACVDAAGAAVLGLKAVAVVRVRNAVSAYTIQKLIYCDWSNVEIVGDGWGSDVFQLSKQPAFLFGFARSQQIDNVGTMSTLVGNTSYRPDSFGKLDTSAALTTGTKWGYRTNANSVAQFVGCPLSSGAGSTLGISLSDNWTETGDITIESCMEPPDGNQFPSGLALFGVGEMRMDPAPFVVGSTTPNKLYVTFRTADMISGPDTNSRSFTVDLSTATKPYKYAIQIANSTGTVTAFLNTASGRKQVAITDANNLVNSGPFPWVPGSKFIRNDDYPFMIGTSDRSPSFSGSTGLDMRVYGLRLSNTIRYQNNGAGTTQTRVDAPATPVDDAWSYFGQDAHTLGFLAGTDNPATSGRLVTVQNGNTATFGGQTCGFIWNTLVPPPAYSGNAIRNLSVKGSNAYGEVVCLGNLFDITFENVQISGGFHGIGCLPSGTSYEIFLTGFNRLSGTDAAYYGVFQLITQTGRLEIPNSGRCSIRVSGCNDFWEHVLVTFFQPTCTGIYSARAAGYGGNHAFIHVLVDFEGYNLPDGSAVFYCDMEKYIPSGSLRLQDIFLGTVGSGSTLVRLNDVGLVAVDRSPAEIMVDNFTCQGSYATAYEVNGPGWFGTVKAIKGGTAFGAPHNTSQVTNVNRFGSTTNVTVVYPSFW